MYVLLDNVYSYATGSNASFGRDAGASGPDVDGHVQP